MPVRLFVGNLPYETTEADLRAHFAAAGQLSHVFIPVDRETGRPRGFAFVEFAERAEAEAAVASLHGQPFRGRTLSVSEARAREDRPAGGPPRPGGPSGPRPGWAPRPPSPGFGPPLGPVPGGEGRRRREFGPDAPPRGKAKPLQKRREERSTGPIPVRGGGRIYDVDDFEEPSDDELGFDDIAKSQPGDEIVKSQPGDEIAKGQPDDDGGDEQ